MSIATREVPVPDDEQPRLDAPPEEKLPAAVEALLFVAEEPPSLGALARALGVGEAAVRRAIEALDQASGERGIRIQEHGGRYQLVTAPELAAYVEAFIGATSRRLSRAALETLSIIAYRQPCSRAEIEAIRGANSDKLVVTLEQRGLIEVTGVAETPGRPKLYAPTRHFYEHFGIRGPDELPPLEELEAREEAEVAL